MGNDDLLFAPIFVDAFRRTTQLWPGVARGFYLDLLLLQWEQSETRAIPADHEELRTFLRATPEEWAKAWKFIEPKFPECSDGLRRNLRLEEHRSRSMHLKVVRGLAGRAGGVRSGQARRSKAEANREAKPEATGEAKGKAETKPPSPSPTPSPSSSPSPSNRNISGNGSRSGNACDDAQRVADHCPEFEKIRELYPRIDRKGQPDWHEAERLAQALVDSGKATWGQLAAAVSRYAMFARVSRTPDCVDSPCSFFVDEPEAMWQQEWS